MLPRSTLLMLEGPAGELAWAQAYREQIDMPVSAPSWCVYKLRTSADLSGIFSWAI